MKERPVFRFAPSPNGELHLGHALSALTTWRAAREAGGRFLLRIEDIDPERSSTAYEQLIYKDLAWLGIAWEEPVRRQSDHLDDYRAAMQALEASGLVYPCFATRGQIARAAGPSAARDPDGSPLYPGLWRGAPAEDVARHKANEPFALRLDLKRALAKVNQTLSFFEQQAGPAGETGWVPARPELWGDVVLARKSSPTSYHLSVVVDDAIQGVSHVTRGQDLFAATHLHRLLQSLLGLPTPIYSHHRLVVDETGRKLSKSAGDRSLRHLRAAGWSAADVIDRIGLSP